ncbi:MAG: transcription antitermination factor NusB [Thermoleophilaceae bacterium]|nr:transcription antitermination factor NusB [Thermoleophilaceae bacterium]
MRRSEQRRAAVFALYQQDVTGRAAAGQLDPTTRALTHELVDGVSAHREQIDALIEAHSRGWTLERIAPLERNIMRVALFEMLHRSDIPDEVAIDEAIESAKELCGAEAPAYVNGVLGAVERERMAPS